MDHELKISPDLYHRLTTGDLTFNVGDTAKGFQRGDHVTFIEWDPTPQSATDRSIPKGYTGSLHLTFRVGYVHVMNATQVVYSLIPLFALK